MTSLPPPAFACLRAIWRTDPLQLRSLRRYDDDWFFNRFKSELRSELCDLGSASSVSVSTPHAPSVSACLVSWKRPQNLPAIVQSLRRVECIDEILVWNNNPGVKLEFAERNTRVIQSPENQSCYGRFLCAAQARNPVVYVQDDDALNHDIGGLYGQFLREPTRIAHVLAPTHWSQRNRRVYGEAQAALLGWGAFFRKEWLSVLEELPPQVRQDWLFRREADAFFTLLLERKHNAVPGQIAHLDGHSTPGIALWCDPGYKRLTSLAIRQALAVAAPQEKSRGPGSLERSHSLSQLRTLFARGRGVRHGQRCRLRDPHRGRCLGRRDP